MANNTFSTLKNTSNVDKLLKNLEEENKSFVDERQWKPTVDTNGNGFAVIRFLPPSKYDTQEWIKYYNHAFKNPINGKWFIENCPTSIGQSCPLCNRNSKLWNTGLESDKNIVRNRKRQVKYVSNVYIISDPKNPDNEGKVFLYTYGTKIFEKIKSCLKPEFQDTQAFDPFNFWTGANFKIKIKNVAKQRNYDASGFDNPSPLSNDDSVLEKIWESEYSLSSFLEPSQYKSAQDLEKRLKDVLAEEDITPSNNPSVMGREMEREEEPKSPPEDKSSKYKEFLNRFNEDKNEDDPF